MYRIRNMLSVRNIGHVGNTVADFDDTEQHLFYGGNYERDNNCEK